MTGSGPAQSVRFTSEPRGATVYVDDNRIGETPVAAELTRKDHHQVRMELRGDSQTALIDHGCNLWMIGNVVFGLGGVIGLVVDLCSGAGDALNPNEVKMRFTTPPAPTVTAPPIYQPTQPVTPDQSDDVMKR